MSIYKQIILEHAASPRNQGHLKNVDAKAHLANPLCGDEISIEIEKKGNSLKDIKFFGTGCIIMKASASLLTEEVKRIKSIKKIRSLTEKDVYKLLGEELTSARQKCANLSLEAIKKALS
jgi:nitrogen fixation NifU-like protein